MATLQEEVHLLVTTLCAAAHRVNVLKRQATREEIKTITASVFEALIIKHREAKAERKRKRRRERLAKQAAALKAAGRKRRSSLLHLPVRRGRSHRALANAREGSMPDLSGTDAGKLARPSLSNGHQLSRTTSGASPPRHGGAIKSPLSHQHMTGRSLTRSRHSASHRVPRRFQSRGRHIMHANAFLRGSRSGETQPDSSDEGGA